MTTDLPSLIERVEKASVRLQSLAVDPRTLAPDGVGDVVSACVVLDQCAAHLRALQSKGDRDAAE